MNTVTNPLRSNTKNSFNNKPLIIKLSTTNNQNSSKLRAFLKKAPEFLKYGNSQRTILDNIKTTKQYEDSNFYQDQTTLSSQMKNTTYLKEGEIGFIQRNSISSG